MPKAKKKETFESAMSRLDEIVKILEQGEIPLDEALVLFEEGTGLLGACGKQLDQAEQKVVRLMKGEDGNPIELPFDETE